MLSHATVTDCSKGEVAVSHFLTVSSRGARCESRSLSAACGLPFRPGTNVIPPRAADSSKFVRSTPELKYVSSETPWSALTSLLSTQVHTRTWFLWSVFTPVIGSFTIIQEYCVKSTTRLRFLFTLYTSCLHCKMLLLIFIFPYVDIACLLLFSYFLCCCNMAHVPSVGRVKDCLNSYRLNCKEHLIWYFIVPLEQIWSQSFSMFALCLGSNSVSAVFQNLFQVSTSCLCLRRWNHNWTVWRPAAHTDLCPGLIWAKTKTVQLTI